MNALDWIDIDKLDEAEMMQCLDAALSKSVYQRAGYLLSIYKDQIWLSDDFFNHCKEQAGNNVSYLSPDEYCDAYEKYWKICVPKKIENLIP